LWLCNGPFSMENQLSHPNNFVISTGAQRSGEICGFLFRSRHPIGMTLEEALISVWRQVFEDATTVTLNEVSYPVRRTSRSKLREVDFKFGDTALRGVEQNPSTQSRWAKLAREGKKVMQFLENGRYVAGVVDGKVTLYH
jgi:hypothetical protein